MRGRVALFVYGTLMDDARLVALTGRRFPRRPAQLNGYARIAPVGGYPSVVRRRGGRVRGILLQDVDPESLQALDRYEDEGRLYVRRPVEVVADGRRIACDVYVGATIRGGRGPGQTRNRASGGSASR